MSFEFKIGQEFRVINAKKSYIDDYYLDGDTFTVVSLDNEGLAWDKGSRAYLNQQDVNSGFVEFIEKHEIKVGDVYEVIDDTGVYKSTIYDETYNTFEEAVVNETFYELMETYIKSERGDFLEHLIDQLTYEQRKEMVKYTLGIKEV